MAPIDDLIGFRLLTYPKNFFGFDFASRDKAISCVLRTSLIIDFTFRFTWLYLIIFWGLSFFFKFLYALSRLLIACLTCFVNHAGFLNCFITLKGMHSLCAEKYSFLNFSQAKIALSILVTSILFNFIFNSSNFAFL